MRHRTLALAFAVWTAPEYALAHAFGQRYDLPLPLGFYLAGAALAVALSFLGSFVFMRPRLAEWLSVDIGIPRLISRATIFFLRAFAVMLLAMVVVTALFGPKAPTQNFALIFIWVIWWVGFTLLTALLVDLWSTANPFQTAIDAALRSRNSPSRQLPRHAEWLAVVGVVFLSWTELVSDWSEDPRAMAILIVLYALGLLAGAATFGRARWFAATDPLSRLFGLLGHIAPIAPIPGGLRLRIPAFGLVGLSTSPAGAVFIITLVAIVLFDGLSETPFWASILRWVTDSQTLRPWLLVLRGEGVDLLKMIRTIGLMTTILTAVLLYALLSLAIWRASERQVSYNAIFTGFAASILPIAVGYHLAHYIFFLVIAGQLLVPAMGDPFGLGWGLFGGGMIDIGAMTAEDVWWVAAASLVTGHALSVFVAHAQAMRLFPSREMVIRSQLPMMVFMVALTSLSLWILAQPVVE